MSIWKATLLYQAGTALPRVAGFSESFYTDQDTAANAHGILARFLLNRRVMLASTVICIGSRVSDVANPGVSNTQLFTEPGQAGIAADIPQMALQLNINSAAGAKRQFLMRGIPDARVIAGEYSPVMWFTTELSRLKTTLRDYFLLRVTSRTEPQIPVQVINGDGSFILAGPMTFNVGDSMQTMRMRDAYGRSVKGRFLVATKTSSTVGTLANWTAGTVTIGRLRRRLIIYSAITSVDTGRITTRKVGRPFVQYSGRRSPTR